MQNQISQIIDISKPTIIKIDNAKLGPAPESFNLLSSDWSLIRTDASNNKTYRTDFSIEFLSNPTNKKFLGPLFVTVDNSNKFVTCFAEYSKEDKCKLLDGVYDTSTNQCQLSQAACPNGQYLVSAGVQKWICK